MKKRQYIALLSIIKEFQFFASQSRWYLVAITYASKLGITLPRVIVKLIWKKGKQEVRIQGVGNYASLSLIPAIVLARGRVDCAFITGSARSKSICEAWGLKTQIDDPSLATKSRMPLVIATPHQLHASAALNYLGSDIYVYLEKPLAITREQLRLVEEKYQRIGDNKVGNKENIMLGYNRRFSPAIKKLVSLWDLRNHEEPVSVEYRINFGPRVKNEMSDLKRGGGRLIGVACHYVDLILFLINSKPIKVSGVSLGSKDADTFSAIIKFENGSIATLIFSSEVSRELMTKEKIVITSSNNLCVIEDFKRLKFNHHKHYFGRQQMGSVDAMRAFLASSMTSSDVAISLREVFVGMNILFDLQDAFFKGIE